MSSPYIALFPGSCPHTHILQTSYMHMKESLVTRPPTMYMYCTTRTYIFRLSLIIESTLVSHQCRLYVCVCLSLGSMPSLLVCTCICMHVWFGYWHALYAPTTWERGYVYIHVYIRVGGLFFIVTALLYLAPSYMYIQPQLFCWSVTTYQIKLHM